MGSQNSDLKFNYAVGAILQNRFRIIELLGTGGMGSVYKVEDIESGGTYALKFLHKQQTNDASWRRFDIEARTANKLDHPNLIKVHETGLLPDGQPYFTMDLVEGESLADALKERGRLPLEKALKIFIQVGFALSYAHSNGVIHRDIKPSNIMLQKVEDDTTLGSIVKVVDFGIAKLTGQDEFNQQTLTRTGEIFGSPLYMSPEQCTGSGIDHRSDLYSLGCVMYEVLTGAPPLVGENALSTMMKHQSETAITLREASMGIEFPEKIEQIVAALLAKDINLRYQSAQLLTSDLVNFEAAPQVVSAATVKAKPKQPKAASSGSRTAIAVIVGVVLFLAGIACGYGIPHEKTQAYSVGTDLKFSEHIQSDSFSKQTEMEGIEGARKTYMAPYVDATQKFLIDMEKEHSYFSFIDKTAKLRKFHFPDVKIGMIGEVQVCNLVAKNTVFFPELMPIEFYPTDLFKKHPALFKRFRSDDLTALNLCVKRTDLGKEFLEFADVNKVLANCTHMKSLKCLNLDDSDLNSEGWKKVNEFPRLTQLHLARTILPGEEIAKFKYFKKLEYFRLTNSAKITPVLEKLRGSQAMLVLNLNKTYLDDSDARLLETLTKLRSLEIGATKITDEAIKVLPANLVELNIESCKLTPACIESFARFKKLRHLKISSEMFSQKELQRLKELMPLVQFNDSHPE